MAEKAAELLPGAISQSIYQHHGNINFLVLGSGSTEIENELNAMTDRFRGYFNAYIGYNEQLSHQMYAGADFLLMPSRVEPCGLNQMYALRYGTMPMVRSTGGLKDTVIDIGDTNGFGIRFNEASVHDIVYSVGRAIDLYENQKQKFERMRKNMMTLDHSWDSSSKRYIEVYESLK